MGECHCRVNGPGALLPGCGTVPRSGADHGPHAPVAFAMRARNVAVPTGHETVQRCSVGRSSRNGHGCVTSSRSISADAA